MAIEYSLKSAGVCQQPEFEAALKAAGFVRSDTDGAAWLAGGASAYVGGTSDRFGRYAEAFGFSPATDTLFRIDKFALYEAGMAAMLRAVMQLLSTLTDDLVLMSNHDTALLLRRRGELILTDRDGWWDTGLAPPSLSYIAPPYRFATLPII